MTKMRLIWVDAGMAVMASVFIAIMIFLRGEDSFVPVLSGYMAALIIWAFLAESAVVSAERRQAARTSDPETQRNTHTELLPH